MGCVVNTTPRAALPRERPGKYVWEPGCAPGPSGQVWIISPPMGFDHRTVQHVANLLPTYWNVYDVLTNPSKWRAFTLESFQPSTPIQVSQKETQTRILKNFPHRQNDQTQGGEGQREISVERFLTSSAIVQREKKEALCMKNNFN